MQEVRSHLDFINEELSKLNLPQEPAELFDPIHYLLGIGGKRIRPALTLLAAEMFSCDLAKALPSAIAIELFHNFSLMHDDIMDKAPLRRGEATVHEKWGINTAILSGDFILIHAYQYIAQNDAKVLAPLLTIFNDTAAKVCIGQQLDMNYEQREGVSIVEYIEMIRLKTAVLLGAALQMGATVANAKEKDALALYQCGVNLGIAFQLQDDYLDVYGDSDKFGKRVGGDIAENKKTFLLLKALELADEKDRLEISRWLSQTVFDSEEKILAIVNIYNKLDVQTHIKREMEKYTNLAYLSLSKIKIDNNRKLPLLAIAESLLNRNK